MAGDIIGYTQEVLGRHVVVEFELNDAGDKRPYLGLIQQMRACLSDDGTSVKTEHLVVFDDGDKYWFDLAEQTKLNTLTWINRSSDKKNKKNKAKKVFNFAIKAPPESDDEEPQKQQQEEESTEEEDDNASSMKPKAVPKGVGRPNSITGRGVSLEKKLPAKKSSPSIKVPPPTKALPAAAAYAKKPSPKADTTTALPRRTRGQNLRRQPTTPNRYAPPLPTPTPNKTKTILTRPKPAPVVTPSQRKPKTIEKRTVTILPYPTRPVAHATNDPFQDDEHDHDDTSNKSTHHWPDWIPEFEYWIANIPHGMRGQTMAPNGVGFMMTRIRNLVAGHGITMSHWPDYATFYKGIPVDLSMDIHQMIEQAKRHCEIYGRTKSSDMNFMQPLRKLLLFQQYKWQQEQQQKQGNVAGHNGGER